MEFYQELLLTAVVAVVLTFLIGKLAASLGSDADDLDPGSCTEDPAIERPEVGGGADFIELNPDSFHGGEGYCLVEEEAEDADEILADGCLESDRIQVKYIVGLEEAGSRESNLEEGNREEFRSEVKDGLDAGSSQKTSEIDEIEVERLVGSLEENLLEVKGCGDESPRGRDSCIGEEVGSLLHGEDEWEGIERSELEKLFSVAMKFTRSGTGAEAVARLSSEVQIQLYGLHKIATEGPCYEPQPLALKVSARAKWHAWQRLGNLNPEVAMEQYISLLSHSIPGWMGEKPRGDAEQDEGNHRPKEGVFGIGTINPGSSLDSQLVSKIQREPEDA